MPTCFSKDCIALINTLTVTDDGRRPMIELLLRSTENDIRHLSGFISANFHVEIGGQGRIMNYAQWRTREDHLAMMKHPRASTDIKGSQKIGSVDWRHFQLVYSRTADQQ